MITNGILPSWTAHSPNCTLAAATEVPVTTKDDPTAAHRGVHPGRNRRFRGPPPCNPPARRRRDPNRRVALPSPGARPGRLPPYVAAPYRPGNRLRLARRRGIDHRTGAGDAGLDGR